MEPTASSLHRAACFLLPIRDAEGVPTAEGRRVGHWFVPIGLGVGVCYAAIFGGTWSVYGEYFGLRLLPAVVVLTADALFFGNRLLRGLCVMADEFAPEPPGGGRALRPAVLLFGIWLLLKFALLLAVPKGQAWVPADWRRHLALLYPEQPLYRTLILMAAWGRWAVLLALSLGRTRPGEGARFCRLMADTRLGVVLGWLLPLVILTVLYCGIRQNAAAGPLVAGITLAACYLAGVAFSWRLEGQTADSVLAVGVVGELAFLFAYVPFGRLIHNW